MGHGEIWKMLTNFSWLAADRVVRLGLNLLVVGWMARYLGREQYGLFNYAMSFTILIGSLAGFGTNNIVIREILRHPERKDEILGSSFAIRQFGGVLTVIICVISARFLNSGDTYMQLLIFISSISYLFGSFDVIDLYFQSQIESKYAVVANNISFLLLSSFRIGMIILKAPLTAFVIAATVEVMAAQMAMVIVFKKTGNSLLSWRWSYVVAKDILRDSWPLMLAVVSAVLYLKIGQVMLGMMANFTELGDYSAAVKISEVWYFVPLMISATIYPKIIEYKNISTEVYYKRMQEFFSLMTLISYVAIIPFFFFDRQIIAIIFGEQFINASLILRVHIWAGLLVAMTTARNSWCNVENFTKGVFYATFTGAIINIVLNFAMIRLYGGIGAALSTLIARIVSGYLFTFFISRRIFLMQTRSLYLKGIVTMIRKDFLTR